MRIPIAEYVALALSSGLGSGPQSVEVTSLAVTSATPKCWASSSGVNANYGPLGDLRIDANELCNLFTSEDTGITFGSGTLVFGFQSATFIGSFASQSSCLDTFNTLVTTCYGTSNPSRPVTLGGTSVDPGGAQLIISFGDGAKLK